ncbi:MAG: methyl-accepting chemotaxis protein [Gammaproteobacteria bacterium]|nr:methyl-accepting chemotaxis protein [Gammaproteobacteria bacterium]
MSNSNNRSRNLAMLALCLFLALVGAMALVFRSPGGTTGAVPAGSPLPAAVVQAREALRGSPQAFTALAETAATLQPAAGADAQLAGQVRASASTILKSQQVIVAAWAAVADMGPLAETLQRAADELQLAAGTQPGVTAQLQRLGAQAHSLVPAVRSLIAGPGKPTDVANALGEAEIDVAQAINALQDGDAALGIKPVAGSRAAEALGRLTAARDRAFARVRDARALADRLDLVSQAMQQLDAIALRASTATAPAAAGTVAGLPRALLVMALLVLAAVILVAMTWIHFQGSAATAAAPGGGEADRNQQAILRLLDELSSLADGDLTVQATVTEDITGAIADSINYAVEALRELVTTINQSAILLDGAARSAESTAVQLAQASEAQSRQVDSASQAIGRMVNSIEEVSGDAERSSDVARHSVDVAHKGGEAVRRTIAGMNAIRETIQDTSKRIKRLGESSQEIGNIVELINDIADQTNILALNASIQASMAGEAGRGFAVVADEVQRLAERSANATKQIEVLVRTIQADTNEAIVSMERSTADVVGGALLAENAGAALEEIEQVSSQIASLVQNISGSAREQAGAAAAVIRIVELLQQINAQNAAGTGATKDSITKLAALAAQLRRSVAGFRLPPGTADARAPRPGKTRSTGAEAPPAEERTLRIVDKKTA